MNKKSFVTILCCLLCGFILFSCNNFFDESGDTVLSLNLPYGSGNSRGANGESYFFKINFIHSSGTDTLMEGNSGETLYLDPAEPGDYKVVGKAYNGAGEIVYEGEVEATVIAGRESKVKLVMDRALFDVEAKTKHMTLTPDKKGVKVMVYFDSSDREWDQYASNVTETNSGLEMELPHAPEPGKPLVLYYPFTKKGQKYNFTCKVKYQNDLEENVIYEKASCTAAGGDDSYFGAFDESYYNTKLILNSANYSVKLSDNMLKFINQDKIDEGKIKNMGVWYNLYSGKSNWVNNEWVLYNLMTAVSQDGLELEYDKLLTGYSLAEQYAAEKEKFNNYYLWWGEYGTRFEIKDLPGQHFKGPRLISDEYEYNTTLTSWNSDHFILEPDAKGIKVTVKKLPGEDDWEEYSKIESDDESYMLNFKLNEQPAAGDSKVYYIGLTESGKYSGFRAFIIKKNGECEVEKLFCKANGGTKSALNIPEKWGEINLDCSNYIMKYDGTGFASLIKNPSVFEDMKLTYFLRAGNKSDSVHVAAGDMGFTGGVDLTNTVVSTGINILDSAYDVAATKYKLGGFADWWGNISLNFKLPGSDTYLCLQEIESIKPYTGTKNEKYIEGEEAIPGSQWYLYYSCFETAKPNISVIESSDEYIKFTIDRDFDNDDFEYQIVLKKTVPGLTGNKLCPNIRIECEQPCKIELNSNDGVKNLIYEQFILEPSSSGETWVPTAGEENEASVSDNISIMVIPYTAGTYLISIEELNFS